MAQANYDEIAHVYDQARLSEAPHLEWWYRRMADVAGLGPSTRLIDLGCGTGRLALPLVMRTGCAAVGLDSSAEMLAKAREKDAEGRVTWVQADLTCLDLESESFDCALMSLVLHFLENHARIFGDVLHLLRPGGTFLLRQPMLEDAGLNSVHRFFPEALAIDRERLPSRGEAERWLAQAGFAGVASEAVVQTPYPDLERVLRELRLRVPSALRMISDEAYRAGLQGAEEYIAQHPDDETLRQDQITFTYARRPR